jgi:hypothetical protein
MYDSKQRLRELSLACGAPTRIYPVQDQIYWAQFRIKKLQNTEQEIAQVFDVVLGRGKTLCLRAQTRQCGSFAEDFRSFCQDLRDEACDDLGRCGVFAFMLGGVEEAKVVDNEAIMLAELLDKLHDCGRQPGATPGTLDHVLLVATWHRKEAGLV